MTIKCNLPVFLMFLGSCLGISGIGGAAFARDTFTLPRDSTLIYSGLSAGTQDSCDVTVRTNTEGRIVYLTMTGSFAGRALSTPSTLRPAPGGFEGVVDFFKGIDTEHVTYEGHIFRPGMTLSWTDNAFPPRTKEASFFGPNLSAIKHFTYSEQGPFLRLKGECLDVSLRSVHP